MAMPALQALRARLPDGVELDIAVKPAQAGLWRMHAAPGRVLALSPRVRDLPEVVAGLRERGYGRVVLLPNSFRSALAPWLAGIPCRRGTVGQGRSGLVNDPVDLQGMEPRHQQWENARLLLGDLPQELPFPRLEAPGEAREAAGKWLDPLPGPRLALIPGAARGPAKRWPADRFRAVAEAWIAERGGSVCWLGTPADAELCARLNTGLGERGVSLAGSSSLEEFAALLGAVDGVLANDSGGMHLAAAMGTPVVAVFGLTDPAKTGPLHPSAIVVQAPGIKNRRIARDSGEARAALEAVTLEAVREHVLAIPPASR